MKNQSQACDGHLMVIHVGDQWNAEEEIFKTLLCRLFTEPIGNNISLFHSVRPCTHFKVGRKFFFRLRFLRHGRVTVIEKNNFHVAMGWLR